MSENRMRGTSAELGARARELRRGLTPAERQLWNGLRGWRIGGFRRQHPIDQFVLDFYSAEARLCVEVDGGVHDSPDQRDRDRARSEALAVRGIRVIRFRNEEVLRDTRAVLRRIKAALAVPQGSYNADSSSGSPCPPSAASPRLGGEGGAPKRGG